MWSTLLLLTVAWQVEAPAHVDPGAHPGALARGWTWDDFPVFVWRQRYFGREAPDELIAPFGGTNVVRDEEAEWVREKGHAFYVTSAAGRNDLHLDDTEAWQAKLATWQRTRDPALLVREPCLSQPETIERMHATLARSLAARGGDHGFGLSLGDEVSLTPGGQPFEACRSRWCLPAWERFCEENGLDAAVTTDRLRAELGQGDFSSLGAWLALRRYEQSRLTGVLADLARAIPADTGIGLLGMSPTTAFSGIDLGALDRLTFVESYPLLDARELQRGLDAAAIGTVFLQEETPDGVARQAWEHWMHGARGLVIWSDALLEDRPELLRRLAETVAAIRAIERDWERHPYPAPIAILHDDDSIRASWLKDALLDGPTWPNRRPSLQRREGTYERKLETWLRLFEDWNLEVAVLSSLDQLEPHHAVLLLPRMLVLDESDAEAVERFLAEEGGQRRVIVDGELAWVDRAGQPWSRNLLPGWKKKFSDRVVDAPRSLERYLVDRGSIRGTRDMPAGLAFLRRLELPGDSPFVRRATRTVLERWWGTNQPRARLHAVLPSLPDGDDPEYVRRENDPMHFEPLPGTRVEWLHPSKPGAPLRSGDAAVFVVRPED